MKASSPHPAPASALLLSLAASGAALAQSDPATLVDQQHGMFRHTRDAPFLAPSFQQIAQRYRNVPDAQVTLEQKLRVDGKPHWGDMAMPLPPDRGGPLTPEDAHTLIRQVLSQ